MLTLIKETEISNHHLDNFKEVLSTKTDNLDWLIVCHNDDKMSQQLSAVAKENTVALLQIPQSQWEMETGELPEAIKWSIQNFNAKNFVIAGHSDAACSIKQEEGSNSNELKAEDCYDSLIDRLNSTTEQTQEAKSHFANEVTNLFKDEELVSVIDENKICVYSLFYLAQSNTFMNFDLSEGTLAPIAT